MVRALIGGALVAQLAAALYLASGSHSSRVVVVMTPIPAPPMSAVPPPAPPAPAITAPSAPACPPPRHDAPHVVTAALPETIDHVHPSPTDARWIAAWNATHVFVSADGGATFARVLDGPGAVADVGFDCFGHAIATRDAMVGIRDATGEVWRPIAGLVAAHDPTGVRVDVPAPRIIDGGPDIVIVGMAQVEDWLGRIAASSDRGVTWRFRDIGTAYETERVHGRQTADGAIRAAISTANCDADELMWVNWRGGHADTGELDLREGGEFELYGDVAIDGEHWARGRGPWRAITGLPDRRDRTSIAAPAPTIVADHVAYRITDGRAVALPWCVDGVAQAIDPAGRLWMIGVDGMPAIAHRTVGECVHDDGGTD